MKKTVAAWVLTFLGGFLVVSAILLATVGPGLSQRTPLNTDSDTYLTGQAKKLNPATGAVDDVPVTVLSKTLVDPKKSDGKVIVFVNYNCVNIDRDDPKGCLKGTDDRLITNTVGSFASNRHTGMAVRSAKYVKDSSYDGLINKFPFDTQKKTYPFYDSLLGKTVPAVYESTTKLQGLSVYKFKVDAPKQDAKVAGEVEGTYEATKELWIEPKTGAIVNQTQHESRLLPDGSTVLDMSLKFTPKTVDANVKDGKANASKLTLLSTTAPIVLGVLGLVSLVAGILLLRSIARRRSTTGVNLSKA